MLNVLHGVVSVSSSVYYSLAVEQACAANNYLAGKYGLVATTIDEENEHHQYFTVLQQQYTKVCCTKVFTITT